MDKANVNNKRITSDKVLKVFAYVFLSVWAVSTIFPFIWVINSSFKTTTEIMTDSFSLPANPSWEHYIKLFTDERTPIVQSYINSFTISVTVCVVVIFLASLLSFALTRYKFRGGKFIYMLLIAAQMFPAFSTIIPNFKIVMGLGLRNNIFSVALVQIAGNLAFASIILTSYIQSLPIDLEEAAFIEGCNVFQILQKVIFPLTKPAFATVAIFSFIWSYNDLFTQIFFLKDKRTGYTINRLLNEISSLEGGTNYGLMAASIVLIVVPVIIVYMFLQKNIVKGLTAGAIKG